MLKIRSLAALACRTDVVVIVLGVAAAALTAGFSAVVWASDSAARAASGSQATTTISCGELNADLPDIFARDCDSALWGRPSANFVVRSNGATFLCGTGWSEGNLWVSGQDCKPA